MVTLQLSMSSILTLEAESHPHIGGMGPSGGHAAIYAALVPALEACWYFSTWTDLPSVDQCAAAEETLLAVIRRSVLGP
jgi:hypothetical protein